MPVLSATSCPHFELEGATFTGLAAPSRGATENAVWRVRVESTDPGAVHHLDREEIIVALAGRAVATIDGREHEVGPGDTVVVPAGARFALRAGNADGFEGLAVLPVGASACFVDGEPFVPPWAQ